MKLASAFRIAAYYALALAATQVQAQLEGTLFTQPDEREYLDYLREEFRRTSTEEGFNIEESAIPEIPDSQVVTPTGPVEFTFGGIMTRRDGSRSVWLNGRVLAESELPTGISVVAGARSASLQIVDKGNTYLLRPGQTVDLTAGTVVENFQRPQPEPEAAMAAPEPVADAAAAEVAVEAADEASDATETTPDTGAAPDEEAITSAVRALDDEALDTLFEAVQSRMLERTQAGEESDEEPDNKTP
jgi:hypothetical protein